MPLAPLCTEYISRKKPGFTQVEYINSEIATTIIIKFPVNRLTIKTREAMAGSIFVPNLEILTGSCLGYLTLPQLPQENSKAGMKPAFVGKFIASVIYNSEIVVISGLVYQGL